MFPQPVKCIYHRQDFYPLPLVCRFKLEPSANDMFISFTSVLYFRHRLASLKAIYFTLNIMNLNHFLLKKMIILQTNAQKVCKNNFLLRPYFTVKPLFLFFQIMGTIFNPDDVFCSYNKSSSSNRCKIAC